MVDKEVVIIGGGASGIMAAIVAARCGKRVCIIEKEEKLGKKILVTGNGRCNLTNLSGYEKAYNTDISIYLKKFNQSDTLNFFESLGQNTYADEEGRVYPLSNSASNVVELLLLELKRLNVEVILQEQVFSINKLSDKFELALKNKNILCKKVVLSVGGNAGLDLIKSFDIKTKPFIPSLCAIKTHDTFSLNGIKISDVTVKIKNENLIEKGEILFKESGLSGIVIFNKSAYFARKNMYSEELSIDLLPNYSQINLTEIIQKNIIKFNGNADQILLGLLNKQVAREVLKRANINYKSVTSPESSLALAKIIKEFSFDIIGTYPNNQVYSGGIELSELTDNLESKTNNNLFFTGEIINVDGICGGYNLQWAWTSGFIVGSNI